MKVLLLKDGRKIYHVSEEILENDKFYIVSGTLEQPNTMVPKILGLIVESNTVTTEDIGKYLANDGTVIDPETSTNPYGIPDSLQEEILSDYRENIAKEVSENGYDA